MLPEDNIQSENFQMWHDWHGKEAQLSVKEVHDCPLSPRCSQLLYSYLYSYLLYDLQILC